MTEKHIAEITEQLPKGETIDRMYKAMEGDIRVITKNRAGDETRYRVFLKEDGNIGIKRF